MCDRKKPPPDMGAFLLFFEWGSIKELVLRGWRRFSAKQTGMLMAVGDVEFTVLGVKWVRNVGQIKYLNECTTRCWINREGEKRLVPFSLYSFYFFPHSFYSKPLVTKHKFSKWTPQAPVMVAWLWSPYWTWAFKSCLLDETGKLVRLRWESCLTFYIFCLCYIRI